MDHLLLWVALAPPQVESLETRGLVPADFTTNRIDLSKDSIPVGRPGDVHDTGGEFSFWDYKLYQLEISALGYFHLGEDERSKGICVVWVYVEGRARCGRSTDVPSD